MSPACPSGYGTGDGGADRPLTRWAQWGSGGSLLHAMSSPIGRRSKLSSLWRLRTYVRPYLGHLLLMTAAAMLATGTQIAVPLLVRRVIDGPIHDGNRSAIIPLGLL